MAYNARSTSRPFDPFVDSAQTPLRIFGEELARKVALMHTEPATILVIDDIQDNLLVIESLLESTYQVKLANSAKQGLIIAQTVPHPDLILLDVLMPYMDGYEICKQLKEHPETSHIPIIFLTAAYYKENEQKGLALGAVAYVIKPINPHLLKTLISTHVGTSHG